LEYNTEQPSKAQEYAERALLLARNLTFAKGEAYALHTIGMYFWFQSLYDAALQNFVASAERYEKLGLKRDVAREYTHIGNVHLRTARYEKALEYYNRSITIAEQEQDSERVAYSISSRAQVIRRLYKDYDRAIQDLRTGIRLFQAAGNLHRVSINTNIIGSVYDDKGDPTQGLKHHLEALALERHLPPSPHIIETLIDVATSLNALHRHSESLPYLQEAVAKSYLGNARHIRIYLYATLARTLAAVGRFQEAYQAESISSLLKDTVFTKDRVAAIAEMQARFDVEQKNRELERERAETAHQRLLRNAFIAALVVFFCLAVWLWFLYKKKQSAEQELLAKQQIIEEQSRDIQEANTRLQEQNVRLQQMNEEKNEFLGIAVHDLKNPLSAIYLTADLINQALSLQKINKITEYTDAIRTATNQMLAIVGNLLDINKLEQGGWQMNLEAQDNDIIVALVEAYRAQADAKNIQVTLTFELPEHTYILADYTGLQHLLDNLLSNAIKYSPRGSTVDVGVRQVGAYIQVLVRDSGQGLSETDKKLLFGKFVRLSARPTAGESSTGLGLSIAKKLADMMNARLWCESKYGYGATFIVEFPSVSAASP
jgi:signal transduction histidine kinase